MNIRIKNPLLDTQNEPPIDECPRCKLEIYYGDDVEIFDGRLVHEDCLTDEELKHCVLRQAALYMASLF